MPQQARVGTVGFGFREGAVVAAPGQQAYTSSGTYTWTCPAGITSVCVVCVGAGGTVSATGYGGGGGGLGWKNNISVSPGSNYTVVVAGVDGSYFISTATVRGGNGAQSAGGTFTGDGGGNGGTGQGNGTNLTGGSGAGGYAGNGGVGRIFGSSSATNGSGGGGAGGQGTSGVYDGGGVGILGQGANGDFLNPNNAGSGGSGKTYGGGGFWWTSLSPGGPGAVRIIWGSGRSFPSTNTGDV